MPTSTPIPRRLAVPVLCALIACASGAEAPPPSPFDALSADSARIMEELRTLSADALQGRLTGSTGAAVARTFLAGRLAEAGVAPLYETYERTFSWTGTSRGATSEGVNVIGVLRGSERPDRYLVLSAHYDHVGVRDGQVFNGADDNASGAVGLLAIARALRGDTLRHSIVFAAFDAEESGLRGARAFLADPPVPLDRIELDVNLDMVARTAGLLWASGAHHTPALRPVLERVASTAPVALRLGHDRPEAPEGDDWTRSSDHGAFHEVGIPFVYFGVEDHADYHRASDDFEKVDPGEYMGALRTILASLLALDAALPLDPGADK